MQCWKWWLVLDTSSVDTMCIFKNIISLPVLMSLWVFKRRTSGSQGSETTFLKCLLIEQPFPFSSQSGCRGKRSTDQGLRVDSVLHWCRWWYWIHYEALREIQMWNLNQKRRQFLRRSVKLNEVEAWCDLQDSDSIIHLIFPCIRQ